MVQHPVHCLGLHRGIKVRCISSWHNESGNIIGIPPTHQYLFVFLELRMSFNKYFVNDKYVDDPTVIEESPSALWTIQLLYMSQEEDKTANCHIFSNNFYTH